MHVHAEYQGFVDGRWYNQYLAGALRNLCSNNNRWVERHLYI
jgi:hypothetical protein